MNLQRYTSWLKPLGKLKYGHLSYYFNKRSYYYNALLNQYVEVDKYISLYKDTDTLTALHTDIRIMPNLLGRNIQFVNLVYGKPLFFFTEKNITVFIYKWKLNNIKVRCEIHFYMDQVFFVNHNFQSQIGQERDFVIKSILKKYLAPADAYDLTDKKIVDRNHNMLVVSELMGLKINYFSAKSSEWFKKMSSEIEAKIQVRKTLDQLNERRFLAHI